jgi:predicted molibdopterin-dependent oxidoreductase YjgC
MLRRDGFMVSRPSTADLRVDDVERGAQVTITIDGLEVLAFEGESVLAALWARGHHTLHVTARQHEPRGFFCAMGVCFDCLLTIDGARNVRACLEPVRAGMTIQTQRDAGYGDES